MANAKDSPPGAGACRHDGNAALRSRRLQVPRIYATLAATLAARRIANLMRTPDEQAFRCEVARRISTTAQCLGEARRGYGDACRAEERGNAHTIAWRHAVPAKSSRR